MQELNVSEVEQVSGGIPIALFAMAIAIIVKSDKLSEFAAGVIDGYNGA